MLPLKNDINKSERESIYYEKVYINVPFIDAGVI